MLRSHPLLALFAFAGCVTAAAVAVAPASASPGRAKQLPPPWTSAAAALPRTPGQRILETADRMIRDGVIVPGSCYSYIDEVFDRAGHSGWRRRQQVYHASRNGPYADLALIEPGDWLYIVNHPDRRPVGTHSVIFVRWADRAAGYAEVVSYVGRRAQRPAYYTTYDVSRTYHIGRAAEERPGTRRRSRRSRTRSSRSAS